MFLLKISRKSENL